MTFAVASGKLQVADASHPKTLADVVDGLDWEVATRGPLLIVSPEAATPAPEVAFQKLPSASADLDVLLGVTVVPIYPAASTAAYFDRQIVQLKTVAVFAPRTMRVLNYERFPPADIYAGMSADAKINLLSSTFTESQWQKAASDRGIGLADLDAEQQSLFLSELPDPFRAQLIYPNVSGERPIVTLTQEQREEIRLQFARTLSWSLIHEKGIGTVSMGSRQEFADPSVDYRVIANPPPLKAPSPLSSRIYGVDLSRDVPNRLKPSQLPENWPAMEALVDLSSAKTVGQLVAQIARQTGTELYCDPRYADRVLLLRGESAKAADLLRALAWALTATWRRLDSAFVLTDDLVGLGTRHVKIDDWVQQNALLARQRNAEVARILRETEYRSTKWSSRDPNKPDDALASKIDAFVSRSEDSGGPLAGTNISPDALVVPVSDLSAAAQETFRSQLEQVQAMLAPNARHLGSDQLLQAYSDLRTDAVQLSVGMEIAYVVPGLGRLWATGSTGTYTDLLSKWRVTAPFAWSQGPVPPIGFGMSPAARALVVSAQFANGLDTLAQEAHARGFDQLWLEIAPGQTDLLADGIRVGKANGLDVHAVVSVLRSPGLDASPALDRNITGETTTQSLAGLHQEMTPLMPVPRDKEAKEQFTLLFDNIPLAKSLFPEWGDLFLQRGDYQQITEAERQRIVASVAEIAATPGLAGVVLQDTVPPGSETLSQQEANDYYGDFHYDARRQMGYTPDQRLACLRQNGFDPIDLSPLSNGDRVFTVIGDRPASIVEPNIALPFFRDFGSNARLYAYNGQSATNPGAKDAWQRWCAFRQEQSNARIDTIANAIVARAGNLPIRVRRYDDPLIRQGNTWRVWGKPVEILPRPATQNSRLPGIDSIAKGDYLSLTSQVVAFSSGTPTREEQLRGIAYWLAHDSEWGGVVLDLSDSSPTDAMSLLKQFPVTGK